MPRKLSDEQKSAIMRDYLSGINTTALSLMYGVTPAAIRSILTRRGVELRGRDPDKLAGKEEEVKAAYLSGLSLSQTANKFSVSVFIIYKLLKLLGVATQGVARPPKSAKIVRSRSAANRKYSINETVFDEINTEDKAYWLGFLYADGHHHLPKYRVSLELQERDKHMVEAFRQFMGYAGPLKTVEPKSVLIRPDRPAKSGRMVKVVIQNVRISGNLLRWGMRQNKTFDINFPHWLPEPLLAHFIRGFFDGDGTLGSYAVRARQSSKQYSAGFIGHVTMMTDLRLYLENALQVKFDQRLGHPKGHPDIHKISMHGRATVLKFCEYIYQDATVFLARKKEKYDLMLIDEARLSEHPNGAGRTSRTDALHIHQLLVSGLSAAKVAAIGPYTIDTVCKIKNGNVWASLTGRARVYTKPRRKPEQVDEINRLLESGASAEQIARQVDMSVSSIYGYKRRRMTSAP